MMYTTSDGPRYGGLTVVFFDHHGRDGEEQVAGTLTIPDYVNWGGQVEDQPFTAEHIAIAIWNLSKAFDDAEISIHGRCMAIVDEGEPMPPSCPKSGWGRGPYASIATEYNRLEESRVDRESGAIDTSLFPYPEP
jgi:hypothetical protein